MIKHLYLIFTALIVIGCGAPARVRTIRINSLEVPKAHFAVPLKNAVLLSPFGKRKDSFHTGIDIRGRKGAGDKVTASRDGKVIQAEAVSGYGKSIVLLHADGYRTRYAHLKKYYVKQGAKVKMNEVIGLTGNTGRSSGPHLHFEIISPANRFINPKFIFKNN